MEPLTLTFTRRGALLTLRRERRVDGAAIVAIESGRARTFFFTDPNRLLAFQRDLEAFLWRTGWSAADGPVQQLDAASQPVAARDDDADRLRLALAEEEEVPSVRG